MADASMAMWVYSIQRRVEKHYIARGPPSGIYRKTLIN
jgi:hypothetical protein